MPRSLVIALIFAVAFGSADRAWALAEPSDLGLDGARVLSLAQGGGFVFAAVRGPQGIVMSNDFGQNWKSAKGGSYTGGTGVAVLTTADRVFAIAGRSIYSALFSNFTCAAPSNSRDSGDATNRPCWEELDLSLAAEFKPREAPQNIVTAGNFVFVSTNYARLKIIKLENPLRVTDTSLVLGLAQTRPKPVTRIAANATHVFAFVGRPGEKQGKIRRASYTADGVINSPWINISPPNTESGAALTPCTTPTATPTNTGTATSTPTGTVVPTSTPAQSPTPTPTPCSIVNCGKFGGVFSSGTGEIYVTTYGRHEFQPNDERGVYKSSDGGICWSLIKSPQGDQVGNDESESFDIQSAAFFGDMHFIGRYVSGNDGVGFSDEIDEDDIPSQLGLDGTAMLVDSSDADCSSGSTANNCSAMATSPYGPMVTGNIEDGSSASWQARFSGLRGLRVKSFEQSVSEPNYVVLALIGGIARTTNFNPTGDNSFDIYVPQECDSQGNNCIANPAPVFAIAVDPNDPNIVYVGTSKLYRVTFSNDTPPQAAWTTFATLNDNSRGKAKVRQIVITDQKIYVAWAAFTDTVKGTLRIFDAPAPGATPSTFITASGLEGKPISSIIVIPGADSSSDVVYAALGGVESSEEAGEDVGNLGLFRSSDGGGSFTEIEDDDTLPGLHIAALAYDQINDVLYVGANEQGVEDEFESPDKVGQNSETDLGGSTLYVIKKASKSKFNVVTATKGLPTDKQITAVAVDNKNGSGTAYVAVGQKLYQSNSFGDRWALLSEGETDEITSSLVFDDLVQGSTSGFSSVLGTPNLVISSVTSSVSAGSRKKIEITFSKNFLDTSSNKRRVSVKLNNIKTKIAKRNALNLTLQPKRGNSWPDAKNIKVRVKPGFLAEDGEGLDSDYDEAIDGNNFTQSVKVK